MIPAETAVVVAATKDASIWKLKVIMDQFLHKKRYREVWNHHIHTKIYRRLNNTPWHQPPEIIIKTNTDNPLSILLAIQIARVI